MLEGLVEFSIVNLSQIEKIKNRYDSEYYQRFYIELEKKINSIGEINIAGIGSTLDCSAFYPSITEYYNFNFEGIPFLRVNEIQNGLVSITSNTAFLPESVLKSNPSTIAIVNPNDIVIAKGGNTLAKLGLVTDEYPFYAVCRDMIVLRTENIINYNKYFLWVFLHSKYGQALLWRTASQTGQPHLTLPSIAEIGLPKYSAPFENNFEELYKRSLQIKHDSILQYTQAETLLLQSIGLKDFKPSAQTVNIKSFKDSFSMSGRLDAEYYQLKYEEILEALVENGIYKISDVFSVLSNPSPSEYQESGIKVIKTKNIRIPSVDIVNITDHTSESKILVQKNDLLFASMGVGSLGRLSFIDSEIENYTTDGTLKIFRAKESFRNKNLEIPTLLFLTSKYGQELIYKYVIGSTGIISISKENIENLVIPKVSDSIAIKLTELVHKSQQLKIESEILLEISKKAVEMAIEEGEDRAMEWMAANTENELKSE